jgi:hypothetical protein
MSSPAFRVAWYRFRATLHRRWGGYVALVLLVGLLGGVALGAVAGARRTQSSYPAYLASTNPSDLTIIYGGATAGFDPTLTAAISRLLHVRRVESLALPNVFQLGPGGAPVENGVSGSAGTVDGLWFDQDRFTVVQGRKPDPRQPGEAVATMPAIGSALNLHTSMGTGALIAVQLMPGGGQNAGGGPVGPGAIFVRLRPGADSKASRQSLDKTAAALNSVSQFSGTVAVAIGTIVGVPLGIALGRSLWDLFAREIFAVPQPAVPALTIVSVAVGGLILANVVAAIPGRQAGRTPTALVLRSE